MSAYHIDASEFPVVVGTWEPVAATPALVTAFCAELDEYLLMDVPVGIIVDSVHVTDFNGAARNVVAGWLTSRRDLTPKNLVLGYVIAHAFHRGALTALSWVHPPIFPQGIFSTLIECKQWVKEELAKK